MKQRLTLKGFIQSKTFEKLFARRIEKLKRLLTNFVEDMPMLTVYIKKHDKNHFYSGLMSLTLPKKPLIAHTGGRNAETVMEKGFEKIYKEFQKYKGTHFKGSSKYPDHSTIRKFAGR